MDSSDIEGHYLKITYVSPLSFEKKTTVFLLFKKNSGKVYGGNSTSLPLFYPESFSLHFSGIQYLTKCTAMYSCECNNIN